MRRWLLRLWGVILIGGVMGGCAQMTPLLQSRTALLEEYKVVRSWSVVQADNAMKGYERRYVQTPTDMNRVRLALALGFSKGTASDPKRALQLFEETAKRTTLLGGEEVLFAEVFGEILRERLQSENKLTIAEARINALTKQSESERARADELERKLEAIKVIEKSLRKR